MKCELLTFGDCGNPYTYCDEGGRDGHASIGWETWKLLNCSCEREGDGGDDAEYLCEGGSSSATCDCDCDLRNGVVMIFLEKRLRRCTGRPISGCVLIAM